MKKILKSLLRKTGYEIVCVKNYKKAAAESGKIIYPDWNKINYGCFNKIFDDWLNVDINPRTLGASNTLCLDLVKTHPFPDNYFEYAYTEDFIEHIAQHEQIFFLAEAARTMKKNGVLRISTPDLQKIINKHQPLTGSPAALKFYMEEYKLPAHICYLTRDSLESICLGAGFSSIRFLSYQQSGYSVFRNTDTRPGQQDTNIFAEIIK
ncbi:MAG TPA: hypothetical protein DC049_10045 [Spirochaetia bacterium]|nr:hypothetical protein [Spirochaetia bacterium]